MKAQARQAAKKVVRDQALEAAGTNPDGLDIRPKSFWRLLAIATNYERVAEGVKTQSGCGYICKTPETVCLQYACFPVSLYIFDLQRGREFQNNRKKQKVTFDCWNRMETE